MEHAPRTGEGLVTNGRLLQLTPLPSEIDANVKTLPPWPCHDHVCFTKPGARSAPAVSQRIRSPRKHDPPWNGNASGYDPSPRKRSPPVVSVPRIPVVSVPRMKAVALINSCHSNDSLCQLSIAVIEVL